MAISNRPATNNPYTTKDYFLITFTHQSNIEIDAILENLDYKIVSQSTEATEDQIGYFPVLIKMLMNESSLAKLKSMKEVENLTVVKKITMAKLELLESSENDCGAALQVLFKTAFPYVMMDQYRFYYLNQRSTHLSAYRIEHRCSYIVYVPINIVSQLEEALQSASLFVLPICYEFRLEMAKNFDGFDFMQKISKFDKRVRIRHADATHLECKLPPDIAMKFCLLFEAATLKIEIIDCCDPEFSIALKKNSALVKAIISEKQESKAIGLLRNTDINPNECVYAVAIKTDHHPLFSAAERGMHQLVAELLLPKYRTDVNMAVASDKTTVLLLTCQFCPPDKLVATIDALLQGKADLNCRNIYKQNGLDILLSRSKRDGISDEDLEFFRRAMSTLLANGIEAPEEIKRNCELPSLRP